MCYGAIVRGFTLAFFSISAFADPVAPAITNTFPTQIYANQTLSHTIQVDDADANYVAVSNYQTQSTGDLVPGDQYRVNTYSSSHQHEAAFAQLNDGSYIIAWQSYGQDSSGYGLYAQRYSSDGQTIGGEFPLNSTTAGEQQYVALAPHADGGFVAAWESDSVDGDGKAIVVRRFAADGTPANGESVVNTVTTGDQARPDIVKLSDNSYVVAWHSASTDGTGNNVVARALDSNAVPTGSEWPVNVYQPNDQERPKLVALSNDQLVIVWQSLTQDGSGWGVYLRRFQANGTPIDGSDQLVNQAKQYYNQHAADVAVLNNDSFVVTFTSYYQGADSENGVFHNLYNASGALIAADVMVNTQTVSTQEFSTVAGLANGGYVIGWESYPQDGSGYGVYLQRYDNDGTPVGGETLIPENITGDQRYPVMGALADGGFVAVFRSEWTAGDAYYGVHARNFSVPQNPQSTIQHTDLSWSQNHQPANSVQSIQYRAVGAGTWSPAVAILANGIYAVALEGLVAGDYEYQIDYTENSNLIQQLNGTFIAGGTSNTTADSLTYYLDFGPAGMTIDATTGIISWTPTEQQIGSHVLNYSVVDSDNLSDSKAANIVVEQDPYTPGIYSAPVTEAYVGMPYSYTLETHLISPGSIRIWHLNTAPAGMTISPVGQHTENNGTLSWTPTANDVGDHTVYVILEENDNYVAEQQFTLTVTELSPLNITSTPITSTPAEAAYSYQLSTDSSTTVAYALTTSLAGMTINASTGLIAWTPTSNDLGDHTIAVVATDEYERQATQSYVLNVFLSNTPPQITSTPVTNAIATAAYSYDVEAIDAESAVVYALGAAPSGMSIDAISGLIAWTPSESQTGVHSVSVVVSDEGGLTAQQDFQVDVVAPNHPPVITSAPVTQVNAGDTYSYDVEASDPDGDTLTFSLLNGPTAMTIDAAAGVISWSPSLQDLGTHPVSVQVSDGVTGTAIQNFDLEVTDADRPPVIISEPPYELFDWARLNYTVQYTDPDANDTHVVEILSQFPANYAHVDGDRIYSDDANYNMPPIGEPENCHTPKTRVADDPVDFGQSELSPQHLKVVGKQVDASGNVIGIDLEVEIKNNGLIASAPGTPITIYSATWDGNRFSAPSGATPLVQTVLPLIDAQSSYFFTIPSIPFDVDVVALNAVVDENNDMEQECAIKNNSVIVPIYYIRVVDSSGLFASQVFTPNMVLNPAFRLSQINDQVFPTTITSPEEWLQVVDLVGPSWPRTYVIKIAAGPTGMRVNQARQLYWRTPLIAQSTTEYVEIRVSDTEYDIEDVYGVELTVEPPANPPIVADAGDQASFCPGAVPWYLDASHSANADQFAWDLDNDGEFDDATGVRPNVTDAFSGYAPGEYTINYKASISSNSNEYTKSLLIEENFSYFDHLTLLNNTFDEFSMRLLSTQGFNKYPQIWNTGGNYHFSAQFPIFNAGGPTIEPNFPVEITFKRPTDYFTIRSLDADEPMWLKAYLNGELVFHEYRPDPGNAGETLYIGEPGGGLIFNQVILDVSSGGPEFFDEMKFTYAPNYASLKVFIRDPAFCNCGISLIANANTDHVDLSWTNTGAPGYAVYASPISGGAQSLLATLTTGVTNYSHAGLQLGDEFAYTVVELDAESANVCQSNVVTSGFPIANSAPVVTSQAITDVLAEEQYRYDVDATDADGHTLHYGLIDPPDGMIIDGNTGVISWFTSDSDVNVYSIEVVVDDLHGGVTSHQFPLTVSANGSNRPPIVNSIPREVAYVNMLYRYQMEAYDPDGDIVRFDVDRAPNGITFNKETGELTWYPSASDVGTQSFLLRAWDGVEPAGALGGGSVVRQLFYVTVFPENHVNQPPVIHSINTLHIAFVSNYTGLIDASDPDLEPLTYDLLVGPTEMSVNRATGELTWAATNDDIGVHSLTVRATDPLGAYDERTFQLYVGPVTANRAPEFTSAPLLEAVTGTIYQYVATAKDPDGDPVSYKLLNGPANLSFDEVNGTVLWTPEEIHEGTVNFVIEATDGQGGTSVQRFPVKVLSQYEANEAPRFTSIPIRTAKQGVAYAYTAIAVDPENDTITYDLQYPLDGMSIDPSTGVISWIPTVDQGGQQLVVISASDGQKTTYQSFDVVVDYDQYYLDATLTIDPKTASLGDTLLINVDHMGSFGVTDISIAVNGIGVETNENGEANYTPVAYGRYEVVATITDESETIQVTDEFLVIDPSDTTPPVAELSAPILDSRVTQPVDVIGTASDSDITQWTLSYSYVGESDFTEFASGTTSVANSVLSVFDPTLLNNGQYVIRLDVQDIGGNTASDELTVLVDGDFKVGNFTITYLDMTVPMTGIPINITRTYDSRRRGENLDFGHGWSVGYQEGRVQENKTPGLDWELTSPPIGSPLGQYCIKPLGKHSVTVTLPGGDVESFKVVANPECGPPNTAVWDVTLWFEPESGTTSTLTQAEYGLIRIDAQNNLVYDPDSPGVPVDPSTYQLKTRAGFTYQIKQGVGIETIWEPNGSYVLFTDDGVIHSGGKSITFTRDASGRIETITDPKGNKVLYGYDAFGDLETVTNQVDESTGYTYYRGHYLNEILNDDGSRPVKNHYDDDGRLYAQEDADGVFVYFNHDIAGKTSVVTDRQGRITTYVYNEEGDIRFVTNPENEQTEYVYDEYGFLRSTFDHYRNETITLYDDKGDLLTHTDAEQNTTTYSYTARGQIETIKDPLQTANPFDYQMVYDAQKGNLKEVNGPLGSQAIQTFDELGRVETRTNVVGEVTTFRYDMCGDHQWVCEEEDNLGHIVSYTYDENGNKETETTTRTDVDGNVFIETSSYTYDALNRIKTMTNALGQTTRIEYNYLGKEAARIEEYLGNRRTEFDYDDYGRLIETRYADGTRENRTYYPEGALWTVTDRGGRTTSYEYDGADRLRFTHYSNQTYSETVYDLVGRVTEEYDEKRNKTSFDYYDNGRLKTRTDHLGHITSYTYYPDGNLETVTDANQHTTTYFYDELGNRDHVVFHDQTEIFMEYDNAGQKILDIDQRGIKTKYDYALGRLTKVTQDLEGFAYETSYGYDAVGNKMTQTDAKGHITKWKYDALGRVLSRELPMGQLESFTYHANGQVETHIDFKQQVTTYTYYPSSDRLFTKSYHDGRSETYTYYDSGQIYTVTDELGTTTFTYDVRDQLKTRVAHDGYLISYDYDFAGNRSQVVTSPGVAANTDLTVHTVDYGYDELNRLATVTDAHGQTVYTYDFVGNRKTVTYPNGLVTEYFYDDLNRLDYMEVRDGLQQVVMSYDYDIWDTGHRWRETDQNGRVAEFDYDNLYRLETETITDVTNGNSLRSYQYDAVGNRDYETIDGENTDYIYNDNDWVVSAGQNGFIYDGNGNLEYKGNPNLSINKYLYDARNLVSGSRVELPGGPITERWYKYDFAGNRVEAFVEPQNNVYVYTRFVLDTNRDYTQVLHEIEEGVTKVSYTYGDDLISQTRNGQTRYYIYDGHGSVRALSDETGAITDTYEYDAFGNLLAQTGSTENDYKYTGEQFDAVADNYYLRARYYDQKTGRFTQMDTFNGYGNDPRSLHKYTYTHNDPVNFIDPTGNFDIASSMMTVSLIGLTATAAYYAIDNPFTFSSPGTSSGLTDRDIGILTLMSMSNSVTRSVIIAQAATRTKEERTVNVYRAVEDMEGADILSCLCFRHHTIHPAEPTAIKRFFFAESSAYSYGNMFLKGVVKLPDFHIFQATISERLANMLDKEPGDPFIGPGVGVPMGLLPAFNAEVEMFGGPKLLGTY